MVDQTDRQKNIRSCTEEPPPKKKKTMTFSQLPGEKVVEDEIRQHASGHG